MNLTIYYYINSSLVYTLKEFFIKIRKGIQNYIFILYKVLKKLKIQNALFKFHTSIYLLPSIITYTVNLMLEIKNNLNSFATHTSPKNKYLYYIYDTKLKFIQKLFYVI